MSNMRPFASTPVARTKYTVIWSFNGQNCSFYYLNWINVRRSQKNGMLFFIQKFLTFGNIIRLFPSVKNIPNKENILNDFNWLSCVALMTTQMWPIWPRGTLGLTCLGYGMHQQVDHFNNCTLCPHRVYVFCICLRTNSDLCHLHKKRLVITCITEMKIVYSAVRTGPLNEAVCAPSVRV
jgi:hypothetical protein